MTREIDDITGEIVDAAYKLHTGLGPGLLESVSEAVLGRSLQRRGLKVEHQKEVAFEYDGMHFDEGLRVDLLVDDVVIVELREVYTRIAHTRQPVRRPPPTPPSQGGEYERRRGLLGFPPLRRGG